MKRLILTLLIIASAFISNGQSSGTFPPTPVLANYEFKETNPAFIVLSNTRELLNVDSADYYFTYDSTMYCRGGFYAVYDYARAFGDNTDMAGKQGFNYNEEIYVGFYDASENKYYNLQSGTKFIYKSLALYYVNDITLGEEIQLIVNPELITSTLNYQYLPTSMDVYLDENLFFSVNSENMVNVNTIVLQGDGQLKVVDRWVSDHYVNRQYTAVESDKLVTFKTTAQNLYTSETKEILANVIVTNSKVNPPSSAGAALFSNEYFQIYVTNGRLYMEALSTVPVYVNFNIKGQDMTKYLVSSRGTKPGDKKLIASVVNVDSFVINWAMYKGIDGLRKHEWTAKQMINESINL